jgi:hypothetical protein
MDNHLSFGCRNWQVSLRFYSLLWIQCSHLFLHRSTKRYCFWLLSYLVDNLRKSNRRLEANSKHYQGINANSRSMRWAGHIACMVEMRNAYILIWKSELNNLAGLQINGRIWLYWKLKEKDLKMTTGFIWLTIGTNDRLFCIVIINIIIGSTALLGPWPSS